MLPCYALAFLGEPPTVMGRGLLPYSIGHDFLLDAIGNPVSAGKNYTVPDAALFAMICSMNFADGVAFLRDAPDAESRMRRFGERSTRFDWTSECQKIQDYHKSAYDAIPPRWQKDRESAVLRVPLPLAFFQILRGSAAITPALEAQLWDTPFSKAAIYAAAAGWAKGDDTLMTERDVELIDRLQDLPPPRKIANGK